MKLLAAAVAASAVLVPAAGGATAARPSLVWLKGEGNFTKSHRHAEAIDRIVIHVTEGAFWGSVRWLKSPRAHASSHYVIARNGQIVQLVHLSDIAWHAGNWKMNSRSVGIEHEGFTYGSGGFTDAQYLSSARLAAWLARRSLLPIDRRHIIGHAEVPARAGGRGGSSHHTDPGPHWNWSRYLRLVRRFAGFEKLSVTPVLPPGTLRGVVPWRAEATGGVTSVEFSINGHVIWIDRRAPFAFAGGRGLNTANLGNGRHVLQVHGIAGPGRYDIARTTVVVANKAFALTSAGARPWTRVRGTVRLRVRPWGAKAARVVFRVDGHRRAVDSHPPFLFAWTARGAKPGKHVLQVVATSVDGREARLRIPLVASRPRPKPNSAKPSAAKPGAAKERAVRTPALAIAGQSISEGERLTGFVIWRVAVKGAAGRVEFWIDGKLRGTDVQRPFTLGWDTASEGPGKHAVEARAFGAGRSATATRTVTVG